MANANIYWRHSRSLERAVVAQSAAGMKAISLASGALSAKLHLRPLPRCTFNPMLSMHVTGTVDGETAHLFMPVAAYESCLNSIKPGLADATLNPATSALVLEAALAGPLDQLEQQLGCKITLSSVELCRKTSAQWAKPDIALRLDLPRALPMSVNAFVPARLAQKVYTTWMSKAAEPSFSPTVTLAVRAGVVRLAPNERATLQPDDVLLLDDCMLTSKKVCLIADETHGARASLSGKQMTLVEAMQPLAGSWIENYSALNVSSKPREGKVITVDIARRYASFQELEAINFESPIDLPQGIDEIVGLYHGANRIASGRFVISGSNIAVRIVGTSPHG